jgi:SAM-dependent methyltransferase
MPAFNDHFSRAAASYASYRPRYPAALFEWLSSITIGRERAWDCGTGSGQAAVPLAERFVEVVASDPSTAQLANAGRAPGLSYVAMTAERAALDDECVDLVTVGQALHWFERTRFFSEVDRVLRPGGTFAVWSYGLLAVTPAIDAIIGRFYRDVLGPFWPSERALVDSGYAGIALPYAELIAPVMTMEADWSLEQLGGYLSTWSAVGRYRERVGEDPLPDILREAGSAWGVASTHRIRWPLVVRAGHKRS